MTRKERRALQFKGRKPRTGETIVETRKPTGPDDFSAPHEVNAITGLMGASDDVYRLMPAYKDIPQEFHSWSNPFHELQSEWFFKGLPGGFPLTPKPGIDRRKAITHLSAIQGSWTPPHEHKSAGIAYLMSLWFEPPK